MANPKIDTKDAIREINALIDTFNNLQKTTNNIGTTTAANFRKVETALNGLKTVANQTDAAFNKLNADYRNMSISQKSFVTQTRNLKEEVKRLNAELKVQEAALEKLKSKSAPSGGFFKGMLQSVGALISAFGVLQGFQLFAAIIGNAYKLTKQFDALSFSLKTIVKDSFDVAESQRFLLEITKDFGVELVDTSIRWVRFLAAAKQSGVTLRDTEQIFKSVTKAASVLGLGTQDLESIYLALEQMMSKGKITTEELRRQLGERLPGAVGIMAAAVGVNVNQLDKMLKKGELLSADVLPKFAKALELAYGIQNVENVDNITAAQNRLTNAWEIFVKSITENSSFIKDALGWIGDKLNEATEAFMTKDQKLQLETIERKKEFEKKLFEIGKRALDRTLDVGMKYSDMEAKILEDRNQIQLAKDKGYSEEKIKQLDNNLRISIEYLSKYNEAIDANEKQIARNNIEKARSDYDATKVRIEKLKKLKTDADKGDTAGDFGTKYDSEKRLRQEYKLLAVQTARLEIYRKLVEVSKATKPLGDDEEGKKAKQRSEYILQNIIDLERKIKEVTLLSRVQTNKELMELESTSFDERQRLINENADLEIEAQNNLLQDKNTAAIVAYKKDLAELEKAIKDKKIIVGDEAKYRVELEKHMNDQITLNTIEHADKIKAINLNLKQEDIKLLKAREAEAIDISQDTYNKQIILAKEVYDASKKDAEAKKELDKSINESGVAMANARIDIMVEYLRQLKTVSGVTQIEIDKIDRAINDLLASKKTLGVDKDAEKQKASLQDILKFIADYADAIAELGDAIYDRKIEAINAEIDAEAKKYDALIAMAYQNDDEQKRLAIEKERAIQELEKKRLREEQKKAKFDKAMAITKIIVNTAIGVSQMFASGQLWAIPLIIGLGALQIAAVAAAPIPQYKDGLKNAKEDHIGMINDGGRQEYVERNGEILTTKTKNAIIGLKKGDTVHKSYDDMINSSELFNNISKASILASLSHSSYNNDDKLGKIFDKHLTNFNKDLKKGIRDGFGRVTINNRTTYDADWLRYKNDTL